MKRKKNFANTSIYSSCSQYSFEQKIKEGEKQFLSSNKNDDHDKIDNLSHKYNLKRKYRDFISKSDEKKVEKNVGNLGSHLTTPHSSIRKRKHLNEDLANSLRKYYSQNMKNSPILGGEQLHNISCIEPKNSSPFLSHLNEDFELTDFSNIITSAKKRLKEFESLDPNLINGGGSFFRYSIQKANRVQKRLFGVEEIITPIRSSKRLHAKEKDAVTLETYKKAGQLVYVPNEIEQVYEPLDEDSLLLKSYLKKDA